MNVEGIWTGEVYGPFGWESRGIFVMEKGRIIGGDHRQYSTGAYKMTRDRFQASLTVHYYGPPQTTFGEAREQFTTELEGVVKKGVMTGTILRPDKGQFSLQCRLIKRMDLPKP